MTMRPLHAIDGGRHRILAVRYKLPADAPIAPLVAGSGREADALLRLARELRQRRIRVGLVHIRRAWIAHCCGSLALYELEVERAQACVLRQNPLITVGGAKLAADQRRGRTKKAPTRERHAKIRKLAATASSAQLAERFGLTDRQIRKITKPRSKRN